MVSLTTYLPFLPRNQKSFPPSPFIRSLFLCVLRNVEEMQVILMFDGTNFNRFERTECVG